MQQENRLDLEPLEANTTRISNALRMRASNNNEPVGGLTPFKRFLDITISLVALIFLAPLILVTALMIRMNDGHPAVFSQNRLGKDGKIFKCYKLRSMVPNAGERLQEILKTDESARREWQQSQKLTNDPRITPIGQFIRKTSIDELPQLVNILKGDMSIVGPRPIVSNEVEKYGTNFDYYSAVKPGLTGLWQISGRSNVNYEQRVAMDVKYARERSFWGDVRILMLTVPAVLFSRGAI